MPTVRLEDPKKVATAHFTARWDEAIALHRELPRLRKEIKEKYGVHNLQIYFVNPWGGPNHTEFNLAIELAKVSTAAFVGAVSKWLLDWGRDFVKKYRKTHTSKPPRKTGRRGTNRKKKGRSRKSR